MRRTRLAVYGLLIALPVLALCAGGTWLVLDKVPKFVRAQKAAVTREYRETAEELVRDAATATYRGPREKGWRQTSRLGAKEGTVPWGHVPRADGELVWIGGEGAVIGRVVPAGDEMEDLALWLYVGVGGAVLLLLALPVTGIVLFARYARARDDFVAAAAHDLGTPLAGVRTLIGRDDGEARALVERMVRMVDNIRDFLDLGGRRPAPRSAPFAVGDALAAAYRLYADDFAEEKSGAVPVTGDASVRAFADEGLTVQIFWNLYGNALKYAAPLGPVSVNVARRGRLVAVSFADAGPGLTPRQRRRAFDRYYRARTALVSGKGGFGIGLCTAREFARAMGGDLAVAANAPKGSVFTLTLPAAEEA